MRGLAPPSVDASGGEKETIASKMSVPNSLGDEMDGSIMSQSDKAIEGSILTICNRVH